MIKIKTHNVYDRYFIYKTSYQLKHNNNVDDVEVQQLIQTPVIPTIIQFTCKKKKHYKVQVQGRC